MCRGRGPACTWGRRRNTKTRKIAENIDVSDDGRPVIKFTIEHGCDVWQLCDSHSKHSHCLSYLCHVVETHEDDGREQEAGGDNQQEHVAEIKKSLVLGWSPGPGAQGHHARASHHRHLGCLSSRFVNKICKWKTKLSITWRWRLGWDGSGLPCVPPKLWLYKLVQATGCRSTQVASGGRVSRITTGPPPLLISVPPRHSDSPALLIIITTQCSRKNVWHKEFILQKCSIVLRHWTISNVGFRKKPQVGMYLQQVLVLTNLWHSYTYTGPIH